MFRPLLVAALVIAAAACKPASAPAQTADAAPPPEPVEISTIYDWNWRAHGGSADLDFGDGDWAEGVSLFHLSCLPNSQNLLVSWGNTDKATLSAGGESVELSGPEARAGTGDPVFRALRAEGVITITQAASARRLVGKAAGKQAVEEFFAWCATPQG